MSLMKCTHPAFAKGAVLVWSAGSKFANDLLNSTAAIEITAETALRRCVDIVGKGLFSVLDPLIIEVSAGISEGGAKKEFTFACHGSKGVRSLGRCRDFSNGSFLVTRFLVQRLP